MTNTIFTILSLLLSILSAHIPLILVGIVLILVVAITKKNRSKPPNQRKSPPTSIPMPERFQNSSTPHTVFVNDASPYDYHQNQDQGFRYRKRPFLLTKNELYFYKTLKSITRTKNLVIFSKVRLADLVEPEPQKKWQTAFNKISSKHVDFVICDDQYIQPILVIELDDSSHQRADRIQRDNLVDNILASAGIPILHTYDGNNLAQKINEAIKKRTA